MSATLVQAATAGGWYGTSPLTIPMATAAGSTLVLTTTITAGLAPVITDTAGNTWVKAGSTADAGATGQRAGAVYYCLEAQPVTSVSLRSSANQNWAAVLSEWSGVQGFRAAEVANTPAGAVPVQAGAGDLVLSAAFYYQASGAAVTPPAGWSLVGERVVGNNYHSLASQVAGSAGSVGAEWSMPASARAVITVALQGTVEVHRPWQLLAAGGPVPLVLHRL